MEDALGADVIRTNIEDALEIPHQRTEGFIINPIEAYHHRKQQESDEEGRGHQSCDIEERPNDVAIAIGDPEGNQAGEDFIQDQVRIDR